MSDDKLVNALAEYTWQQMEVTRERTNAAIRDTLLIHFNVSSYEQAMQKFANKKLALAFDTYNEFIGIIVNNRWLYTKSGQVIGKQGTRWMFEKIVPIWN